MVDLNLELPAGHTLVTVRERPDLDPAIDAHNVGIWQPSMLEDAVARRSALAASPGWCHRGGEREVAMTMTPKVFEPFSADIAARARANSSFREVVSTGPHAQVVVMSIPAGGEIGDEVHPDVDQVLVFVAGEGVAVLEGQRSAVGAGRLVHVPAGTRHNFVNEGPVDLKLYTIYAPPQHAPGTIHRTKAEADADEEHA